MTYIRVIPRDLFNEANLLKCLGHLYIQVDGSTDVGFAFEHVSNFDIEQNPNDGSIFVANLPFHIKGKHYHLSRPLNSRKPWPLWLSDPENYDFDPIPVFAEDSGLLSDEFAALRLKRGG